MFSLLYGLWKYIFSKAEFHVLILGIDKAGKTTLLEKLKTLYSDFEGLPPDRIVPTVGLNIGRVEAHKSKLIFWDLGGQLGLRTIWEKYYEEAHAVLYVVDSASPSRFEDTKSALEKVLRHEDLQGAPMLIFANKQDLPGAVSAEELSRYLDLKELSERPSLVQAMSAIDGSGVREGVLWLVEAMKKTKRTEELNKRAESAVTCRDELVQSEKVGRVEWIRRQANRRKKLNNVHGKLGDLGDKGKQKTAKWGPQLSAITTIENLLNHGPKT